MFPLPHTPQELGVSSTGFPSGGGAFGDGGGTRVLAGADRDSESKPCVLVALLGGEVTSAPDGSACGTLPSPTSTPCSTRRGCLRALPCDVDALAPFSPMPSRGSAAMCIEAGGVAYVPCCSKPRFWNCVSARRSPGSRASPFDRRGIAERDRKRQRDFHVNDSTTLSTCC